MGAPIALRVPTLEWSQRAAFRENRSLGWVDTTIDPGATPFKQRAWPDGDRWTCRALPRRGVAGRRVRLQRRCNGAPLFRLSSEPRRFRHLPYSAFLPPPIAELARDAQRRGRPTVHEAMLMVMARLEWLVASRQYLWSPLSSTPRVLAMMVESFGVDADLHRHNPGNLLRLAALMPSWHPHRGTVERARELLETCNEGAQVRGVSWIGQDGPRPESLREEVFACRGASWWARRRDASSASELRVEGGLLRFQPTSGQGVFALTQEDILINWSPGRPLPRDLVRLLPVWTVVRLVVPTGSAT